MRCRHDWEEVGDFYDWCSKCGATKETSFVSESVPDKWGHSEATFKRTYRYPKEQQNEST